MPVKWLLHWQPGTGTQVTNQTLVEIMRSIESITTARAGRWQVTAAHYRPTLRDPSITGECARDLLGVAFSENPSKYFFILRAEHMVVEADSNIQEIMEKLQTYRNRLTLLFEGFQYQLGDFHIKAGRAVLNNESLCGIVMEVEYLPVSSLEKTRMLLQEFVDLWQDVISKPSLNGRLMNLEPPWGDYSLSDNYTWQHAALQYISLMAYFTSQRS